MTPYGTVIHQKILACLVRVFGKDANIRAFGVFGSLVRGDWDEYSDLDLDAVVVDASRASADKHVAAMKAGLAETGFGCLLWFEERPNEWVIILDNLGRISIRFHTLEETSPNIIDSLVVLAGGLTSEDIAHAAAPKKQTDFDLLHHKFLEHAIYVPIYLHRGELINACNMLSALRNALITIYCASHGMPKIEKFEKLAPAIVREQLQSTFALPEEAQITPAFTALLQLYKTSLDDFSAGHLQLSAEQETILDKVLTY